MENARLLRYIEKLEKVSSRVDNVDPIIALKEIQKTVAAMRFEIGESRAPSDVASSRSSAGETKITVESVEAAKSGLAPTVAIDDENATKPPTGGSVGFIDAVRMAALGANGGSHSSKPAATSYTPPLPQVPHQNSRQNVSSSNNNVKEGIWSPMPSASDVSTSPSSSSDVALSTTNSFGSNNQTNSIQNSFAESSTVSRRMKYFNKCFPAYRKLFRYESHPRSFFRGKRSTNIFPGLSPDTLHMALVDHHKYQIFEIPSEYNEKPRLKFEGPTGFSRPECYVSMNDMWLVIASSTGSVLVISLETGKVMYNKNLRMRVTALEVSVSGTYIGVAVLRNEASEPELKQPLICLICPSTMIAPEAAFEHPDIVSFSSPYQDPLRTISFNTGETAVVCSTEMESRIFVVSLADYREPRILLRSKRNNSDLDASDLLLDDEKERPEGITGAKFLPNSRYILLSSYAPNTPPVILDTKLLVHKGKSPNGQFVQYLHPSGHQQNVVVRFDKMGSAIQACVASSRGNGAAFADISGSVYAVNLPSISTEPRKIAVVFDLAPGSNRLNAPVLRFSPDGTSLLAVDRKGDIHIADFGAGHPQQPGIMKTKVLS